MESNASKFVEQLEKMIRLFNRTLYWILVVTFVALAGVVCYVVFYHDSPACFATIVLGSGLFVVVCALCWLGSFSRCLLNIQNDCRKQLLETELSLYREAVRREREGVLQDGQIAIAQLGLKIEAKRKELDLAKLERELKALK